MCSSFEFFHNKFKILKQLFSGDGCSLNNIDSIIKKFLCKKYDDPPTVVSEEKKRFHPQFNDLDNIGVTGRHYSGFIMMGNHVFNTKEKHVYFKEETVEFHYRWLTEYLKIDPEEITFIEDVWAGGGNLGPSIEYFVGGLEVGNMVFMQYKTFHDGSREEL